MLSILVWQEGGESVGILLVVGIIAMLLFARWLVNRKKQGKPVLLDPHLFSSKYFRMGISEQMVQNISLGGMMIALPIYFQIDPVSSSSRLWLDFYDVRLPDPEPTGAAEGLLAG